MRLMQRIKRIAPGALNSPLQKQKNCSVLARGECWATGAIGLIRCISRIRIAFELGCQPWAPS
jgi:hypothetical protein